MRKILYTTSFRGKSPQNAMMDGKDRFPVARAQYANHIFRTRRLMCLFFPAMDILRNIGKDARISAGGNLEATSKLRSKTITAMGGFTRSAVPKKNVKASAQGLRRIKIPYAASAPPRRRHMGEVTVFLLAVSGAGNQWCPPVSPSGAPGSSVGGDSAGVVM